MDKGGGFTAGQYQSVAFGQMLPRLYKNGTMTRGTDHPAVSVEISLQGEYADFNHVSCRYPC
jgi:hypothetical protein